MIASAQAISAWTSRASAVIGRRQADPPLAHVLGIGA